ncbi:MAG: hypothetical protein ACPL28_08340 [bacterium]
MVSPPQNLGAKQNVDVDELLKIVREDIEKALLIAAPSWDECCRLITT